MQKQALPENDPIQAALDAKRRADNCLIAIENECKRWNCVISPMITISGRGITPNFEVVPLPMIKLPVGGGDGHR